MSLSISFCFLYDEREVKVPTNLSGLVDRCSDSKAAAEGDPKQLREIRKKFEAVRDLKQICDVYSDFATGRRALHYAAEMGNLVICEILVDKFRAFVDIPSYSGDTPLLEAAKGEHVKVVEYLINHNALHQVPNKKGFTALHYAVLKGNKQLMEILLANGAPTEIDSVDGTPLQIAASLGNLKAVKLLLRNGATPSSDTSSIMGSPLISAIKARSFECVKCLLKAKANPEKCLYGLTPLSHAAKERDTRYLLSLLDAGAKPDNFHGRGYSN
ncbi:uncharacterized protein LOC131018946 [Salvia miltiorrhiza]|uniref:uncharacterized protein LOC131018946 n=1 Tax=Salvia miltiorrhiza TaxID=226208 RepID=UPI0025AB8F57|nr:uncharacterized protein LOC131018946 [Salvia miltiorrhiza]